MAVAVSEGADVATAGVKGEVIRWKIINSIADDGLKQLDH